MSIGKLFIKQFIPTLLGMVSAALFIIVDGIFVGRGIGSDALAAINIVSPLAIIAAGIGLMFGMGGSILASINLSRGKTKVANINITQSFALSTLIGIILMLLIIIFPYFSAELLGADSYIIDAAVEYLFWFILSLPFWIWSIVLPFFIRLTRPNFAMWCMLLATAINIILDYVFIFEFKWGLAGAAVATGIGESVGAIMLAVVLFRKNSTVHFTAIKLSAKSIRLTLRNAVYMMRLGFSTFLSEASIAIMAITGNYVFIYYLGTDGVAAFCIVCYLFPIVFMIFNATVQSIQPIVSFNYGCGQIHRSNQALKTALLVASGIGLIISLIFITFNHQIVSLFIPDSTSDTWQYATAGLPLFAIDFVFFGINIVTIGYYTSIEKVKLSIFLIISRSLLFIAFFLLLPLYLSVNGIWLAVGVSDIILTLFIVFLALKKNIKSNKGINSSNSNPLPTQ